MKKKEVKKRFHTNGKIWMESEQLNGVDHGVQKNWYNNGLQNYIYKIENGRYFGTYQNWNVDGTRCVIIQTNSIFIGDHGFKVNFKYGN